MQYQKFASAFKSFIQEIAIPKVLFKKLQYKVYSTVKVLLEKLQYQKFVTTVKILLEKLQYLKFCPDCQSFIWEIAISKV